MKARYARAIHPEQNNFAYGGFLDGGPRLAAYEYILLYTLNAGTSVVASSVGVQSQQEDALIGGGIYNVSVTNIAARRYSHFGGRHFSGVGGPDPYDWYLTRVGGGGTEIPLAGHATILVPRLDSHDYASFNDAFNTSNSSFQNAQALTPTLNGDYLLIALGALSCGTAAKDMEARLYANGVACGTTLCRLRNTGERQGWAAVTRLTGLSGIQDFKIQIRSLDGATTVNLNQTLLLAIRLDTLADYAYDEDLASQNDTSGSYTTRSGFTLSAEGEYLVVACCQLARAHAAVTNVPARVTVGGVTMSEVSPDPSVLNYDETFFYVGQHVLSGLPAITLDWKTPVVPRPATIKNSVVAALNLRPVPEVIHKGTGRLMGRLSLQ